MERLFWTSNVILEEERSADERFTFEAVDPAVQARSIIRSGSADQYEEWLGRRSELWLMDGFDSQRRFDQLGDDLSLREKFERLALEDRASAVDFGATYKKAVEQERANDAISIESTDREVATAALARSIARGVLPHKPRRMGFVIEPVLAHKTSILR